MIINFEDKERFRMHFFAGTRFGRVRNVLKMIERHLANKLPLEMAHDVVTLDDSHRSVSKRLFIPEGMCVTCPHGSCKAHSELLLFHIHKICFKKSVL